MCARDEDTVKLKCLEIMNEDKIRKKEWLIN